MTMRSRLAVAAFAILAITTTASAFDRESLTGEKALSSFSSVYIAPVAVSLEQDRDDRPVRDKDAAERADLFREALIDRFEKRFDIADAPGDDVLTVEATLTRLEATRPTLADYSKQPGLAFESVYAGGAAFTATLSENGAPLAEISDRYTSSLGDHSPKIATWQDVDRAFSNWARQLVDFVEEN
ncbi:MAG: DUF3313 family protein [Pseudomonadota bacterium]|nr:DUF3313 family protein [Pseudomonadota bacterium]